MHACGPMGPVAPLAAGESETRIFSCCGDELVPGGLCNTAACAVATRVVCDKCTGARELGTGRCHNGEAWCTNCAPDAYGDCCLWCEGNLAPTGPCITSLCKVKMSLVCGICDGPRVPSPGPCGSNCWAMCDACIAMGDDPVREDEGAGSTDEDEGEHSDSADEVEDESVAVAVVHANTASLLGSCTGCATRVHRQDQGR